MHSLLRSSNLKAFQLVNETPATRCLSQLPTANSSERVRLSVILQAKKMSKMLKIIQDYSKFISLSDQAAPVTSSICKFLAAGVVAFPRLRSFIASHIPILWWAHVLSSLSQYPSLYCVFISSSPSLHWRI